MAWSGIGLLGLVALGIVLTGLPAAFVLIAVSVLGASLAVLNGTVPLSLLTALPGRLINLLESDLLQALPLYVLMGLMLDRLPVADALYRAGLAVLPRRPAPLVSGMALGALLGPMNGSVGASVLGLSRVVAPKLAGRGVPAAMQLATIAVASTLGVVIPPSIVLILLGDAMLSAHTIAVTTTGRSDRVINTQDVFHGALLPAGILLLLCLALSWHAGRRITPTTPALAAEDKLGPRQAILAAIALTLLAVLLGGVATGYFYAVEAAAMGAFVLLAAGVLTGRLRGAAMRKTLEDAAATTGALFGLLIAATTFTLVLRLLGTDRVIGDLIIAMPGGDVRVVAAVLACIGLCAFVLDAFEIIFVVIPIVIPPLLVRVADARWVAVLVLLTLQTSFLLPPFGYALMMVRGTLKTSVRYAPLLSALAPFVIAQWLVLAAVLLDPQLVHVGERAGDASRNSATPLSNDEITRRIEEMLPPPLPDLGPENRPN